MASVLKIPREVRLSNEMWRQVIGGLLIRRENKI